ncbi:MAG: hypothetical protein DCC67_06210 [Planctomycetota bacterium]|nr:MAG: hypothetical protein DCC67_06210 [Planctomycetota bacterium]
MAEQRANGDFDDELLSAYVDGELTAAERALVEERLRADPAAARLVAEMRRLSQALRALPRESLGYDLRPAVERATADRRAALVQPALAEPGPPIAERGFKRGLVWSSIAIAATVMLAFLAERESRGPDRDVAAVAQREREPDDAAGRSLGVMRPMARSEGRAELAAAPETSEAAPVEDAPRDAAAEQLYAKGAEAAAEPDFLAAGLPMRDGAAGAERLAPLAESRAAPMAARPAAAPPLPAEAAGSAVAADSAAAAPAEPVQIELVTAAPGAIERFTQLLADQGMVLQQQEDRRKSEPGREQIAATGDQVVERGIVAAERYWSAEMLAERVADPPGAVLVEASVDEISQLLAACENDKANFAEVNVLNPQETPVAGAPLQRVTPSPAETGAAGQLGLGGYAAAGETGKKPLLAYARRAASKGVAAKSEQPALGRAAAPSGGAPALATRPAQEVQALFFFRAAPAESREAAPAK